MPRMDEKKLHTWKFQLKHSSRNMRCKLLQKMFTRKSILIYLKYIKLVIQKYSFYWYYAVLSFTSKLRDPLPPLPTKLPPTTKIKISDPPHSKDFLSFLTPPPPPSWRRGCMPSKRSIKTKSLNTKPCPAGVSPRIICQASPFLPKMSQNCCTHQVWTVPPSPEPLWVILGMGKNPTQQPKIYSFPHSEKSPLIDLNYLLSKVSFLPNQTAIFK